MPTKDDGVDDLIKREPAQPSPYSWAKEYVSNNNTQNQLMQQFQQQIMASKLQQQHQANMQETQLGSADELQSRLQQQREDATDRRLDKTLAAKNDEDTVGETGADGSFTLPEASYNAMPPSGKRRYDHVSTIQKKGKNYITLRPKAAAAARTNADDQYVK